MLDRNMQASLFNTPWQLLSFRAWCLPGYKLCCCCIWWEQVWITRENGRCSGGQWRMRHWNYSRVLHKWAYLL